MPRSSIARAAQAKLDEADPESGRRFVDLQLDFVEVLEVDEGPPPRDVTSYGEVMLRCGGRWDHRAAKNNGDFVGDARRSMRIGVHEGQREAMEWFVGWVEKFYAGEQDEYSAMLAGGRRGGKSFIAVAFCAAFALMVPGSIVWIVSPTEADYEEVIDYLESLMPREWYESLGHPWWRYTLANGSRIVLRSSQQKLKKGRADFVLLNEGQQMKKVRFVQARAAVSDVGGMLLVACNPPDDGDEGGDWVGDFAVEAKAKLRDATYMFVDPLLNPFIKVESLLALAKEVDPRTFDIQVRGMFLGPSDAVHYNWDRAFNEIPAPDFGDITREFTRKKLGKAFSTIVSLDVGRYPKMVAAVHRIYRHPTYKSMDKQLAWCVDEIIIKGDEKALCAEMEARGYMPSETLVVLDASGWWQSQKTAGKKKVELRDARLKAQGRGSFHIMRAAGWHNVVRPDRRMDANPDNIERSRAVCARIGNAIGYRNYQVKPERFYFVDPKCKAVCKAMRNWKYKNGRPDKYASEAHAGDAVGYFVWHFWPRRHIIDESDGVTILGKKTKHAKELSRAY